MGAGWNSMAVWQPNGPRPGIACTLGQPTHCWPTAKIAQNVQGMQGPSPVAAGLAVGPQTIPTTQK